MTADPLTTDVELPAAPDGGMLLPLQAAMKTAETVIAATTTQLPRHERVGMIPPIVLGPILGTPDEMIMAFTGRTHESLVEQDDGSPLQSCGAVQASDGNGGDDYIEVS